jgi:hypothetical protein
MRRRRGWARSVERLLAAINAALLDQRQPVSAQALRQLKPFLQDPNASPLFGEDPALARKAAERLQWSFTGRPET